MHSYGINHDAFDYLLDIWLHRCTKHQLARLLVVLYFRQNCVYLLLESKLKHFVGLVEHKILERVNLVGVFLDQLSKFERSPDKYLDLG